MQRLSGRYCFWEEIYEANDERYPLAAESDAM